MKFNSKTFTVYTLGLFSIMAGHCEDVMLSPYPSPPGEGNMQTVSGSFTNAVNSLTSPLGKHIGNVTKAVPTSMPTSLEWNCLPLKVKAVIDDADVKVDVSWPSSTIYTPAWINRTSHCSSATNGNYSGRLT